VVSGDNLWTISAAHLASVRGDGRSAPTNRQIAVYWLKVCAVNRYSLRSGDLDLIHPGEIVKLPPVAQPPEGGS
jgi:hypothetical protein